MDALLDIPCHPRASYYIGWLAGIPGEAPTTFVQATYTNAKLTTPYKFYTITPYFTNRALCRMSAKYMPTGSISIVINWKGGTEQYFLKAYDTKFKKHRCFYLGKRALHWTSVISPDGWWRMIGTDGTFILSEPMQPNTPHADIFHKLQPETQLLVTTPEEREKMLSGETWIKIQKTKNNLCYEKYENIGRRAWIVHPNKPATLVDITWSGKVTDQFMYKLQLDDNTLHSTTTKGFYYLD